MNFAIVNSRASFGIEAPQVCIEAHLSAGMPSFSIVGLPETAIKESKDRVRSAIMNSGFEFPVLRITVNLAPADLPKKEGGRFDLAMALAILIASKQIVAEDVFQYEFAGELALDGRLRAFAGALPLALATKKANRVLILSEENAAEAAIVDGAKVLSAEHLLDVCAHLNGTKRRDFYKVDKPKQTFRSKLDLLDIYGQENAKRALEIAAAGGHSLLMIGSPGVGKTMLADRLTTIMPEMTIEEALETAAIYSVCGKKDSLEFWQKRPFRSPHHTASSVALVGGSSPPRPGEISLAHNGVLFLDELLEFKRAVLESLREPLESKCITISRAAHQATFPANFQLIVAMNPCPCGYFGDSHNDCSCTPDQVKRYRSRISGPFLDRIDIWISVSSIGRSVLLNDNSKNITSFEVKRRVARARNFAINRAGKINSDMSGGEVPKLCALAEKDKKFLEDVMEKLKFSARSYYRILKIARTIADLAGQELIQTEHLKEAVLYRKGF